MKSQFLFLICVFPTIFAYLKPGPEIKATQGEVWPKPFRQNNTGKFFQFDPNNFQIVATNQNCNLLQNAIQRYSAIIKESVHSPIRIDVVPVVKTITKIGVNLSKPCESLPYYGMDESYYVYGHGEVVSNSIWGLLRGLETLSQILVPISNGMLRIPETEIYDEPRFKYRGLMLDTARHFITVSKILQLIDGMTYNKFNVFHWHMTDDSAFTYNSSKFPELSQKGAYDSRMTYSKSDVAMIVEYARVRGIRVIPEFDTPAHTASWGASHPEILTKCYGSEIEGQLGPLNPTSQGTYKFLDVLFSEIKELFPDKFIHLGGDEVDSACWESNPDIQNYLKTHKQDSGDLPYMFFENLSTNISRLGRTPILWQEAIEENPGIEFPQGTMAQVWYDYKTAIASLTKKGYTTILSDGFYLYGDDGPDWMNFYDVEPTNFSGDKVQKSRVAGGEACLWTEWANNNNVISMAFPRANAVAERLWSKQANRNTDEAAPRLEEHNCRMYWRGIETRPANGFGLC